MAVEPPRVFLSYSHGTRAHDKRVLKLADQLRSDGVDAWIDQYESGPRQGWQRWMEQELQRARFVLVVCTKSYKAGFEGHAKGSGVTWEGLILNWALYVNTTSNTRIIPVLFDSEPETSIPTVLRPYDCFQLFRSYKRLLWRLTGQDHGAPPIGRRRIRSDVARQARRSVGLPRGERPTASLAHEMIEDVQETSSRIEKQTPFRRHLRDRVLRSAQYALDEIGTRRTFEGPQEFAVRVEELLRRPEPGSFALAMCGEKGLDRTALGNYYKSFYEFAATLHRAEHTDRVRVCRIFLAGRKKSAEWRSHIRNHVQHRRHGVQALIVPFAQRRTLSDSDLAASLGKMNSKFGFGFVILHTPRSVLALTHAWDEDHPTRYLWSEWHDPLNLRQIILFFCHIFRHTREYPTLKAPKWREFSGKLLPHLSTVTSSSRA